MSVTITFKNNGQDLLQAVIENGLISQTQPLARSIWVGAKVHNADTVTPGELLQVTTPISKVKCEIVHPVIKVQRHA